MNDKIEKLSELLKPEAFKNNLILCSVFIAYFENTLDFIIDTPKNFFSDTFDTEKGFIPSSDYKIKVLNLDKKPLNASLLWFKELKAISKTEILDFDTLRKYRNKLAHELTEILLDDGLEIKEYVQNLEKLFNFRIKLEKWWFFNYEADFMEIQNIEELTDNDISTGGEMIYKLFMDILSEDTEKANFYSNEFKKHIKNKRNFH